MKVITNLSEILTLKGAHKKNGRNLAPEDSSIITEASVVYDDSEILWVGKTADLPSDYSKAEKTDGSHHVLTPDIVDSHTHLVFAGNRANEYSMRLNGADYQTIADAGGGILASTQATQEASFDELYRIGKERIKVLSNYGVKTIEIKSGYGLSYDSEKKLTQVISKLKKDLSPDIQVFNTYLAAHAIPKDSIASTYLNETVIPLMKELKEEIDFVDIFHEQGYFSEKDTRLLFDEAKSLNLKIKIHADEFNDNNGAGIAIDYNAVSADHLLQISGKNIEKLSSSETIATLLPGTSLFLGKPLAQARKILNAGVRVALASDYNPGSCHCDNLLFIASLAAPLYKLNQTELWTSITLNAAKAVGLNNQGAIIPGMKPRFNTFKCNSISEITYNWGKNLRSEL